MGDICWVSSYPKSGNTWMRVLLTNYLLDADEPADINQIFGRPLAAARWAFDDTVGVSASELTTDEVDDLRPEVYRRVARAPGRTFYKIHDAWGRTPKGELLTPPEVSSGAIYLVRNPLDVAVSFAHHTGWSVESIVAAMADPTFQFAADPGRLELQLRQALSTWSGHVSGWVDQTDIPVHVVRYEDLSHSPEATFEGVVRFLGGSVDPERIERAIAFSRFSELQRQEKDKGFREMPAASKGFFRKGRAGGWRDDLSAETVAEVIRDQFAVMRRFGYLSASGDVIDGALG